MIKTPLSTVIGGAFWTPGATILGSSSKNLSQLIKSLFSLGEQGFAYDPNDLTTLYQDAVGNYPVTAAGQPVGLVLDKSKGLTIGAELITNGDFNSGTTGWKSVDGFGVPTNTSMSVLNGVMTCAGTNGVKVQQNKTLTTGKWYKLTCDVVSTDVAISLVAAKGEDLTNMITLAPTIVTTGKRTTYFMATQADIFVGIRANTAGSFSFDNFTLKEIAGNHAYQTVSASRPILRQTPMLGTEAVVNGNFSNGTANWTAAGGATLSVVAGGIKVLNTTGGIAEQATQSILQRTVKGATYSYTVTLSETSAPSRILIETPLASLVNLQMSIAGTYSGIFTVPIDAADVSVRLRPSTTTGDYGVFDDVTIKEITGYRTDQNYLQFDGVDDFLQTNNIDFTMTDKISLFTGLRKLSDVDAGTLLEFSSAISNVGTFALQAPSAVNGRDYVARANGTPSSIGNARYIGADAPHSAVLTSLINLSEADKREVSLRVNNSAYSYNSTATDGGNFSSSILYIGRRAGSVYPFNGSIYGLIGVGRLTTDGETLAVERELAKQTGVTLNV